MRINIDLPDDIAHDLHQLAWVANTNRKNYIESILVAHARGQKGTLKKIKKLK